MTESGSIPRLPRPIGDAGPVTLGWVEARGEAGYGFVGKEGEAPQRVRAGDTIWIAPNERHWHGATASTLMSHTTTTIGATEFHEAVTEAEYAAANAAPRD